MNIDDNKIGWMILLASAGYDSSRVTQHLLRLHFVFQLGWEWGVILAFSSFFNPIPHQKEPEISEGIFIPT